MREFWQKMGDGLDMFVGQLAFAVVSIVSAKTEFLHLWSLLKNGHHCLHIHFILVHAKTLQVRKVEDSSAVTRDRGHSDVQRLEAFR